MYAELRGWKTEIANINETELGGIKEISFIVEGEGAYSRQHKQIILCVLKRTQIPQLRRLVRSLDERAFVVVSDAKDVFGNGFENISEVR